jgi:hypothetical protein
MYIEPKRFIADSFREYWIITPVEREELHKYRLTGAAKPEQISWGDWIGPRKLKLSHLRACYFFALGMLQRYVCKRIGYTESRLSIILSSSQARNYVKSVRDKYRTYYDLQTKLQRWGATCQEIHGDW